MYIGIMYESTVDGAAALRFQMLMQRPKAWSGNGVGYKMDEFSKRGL